MNEPGTTIAPVGTSATATASSDDQSSKLYGLLAEFETPA